jgi:hypothetical protein
MEVFMFVKMARILVFVVILLFICGITAACAFNQFDISAAPIVAIESEGLYVSPEIRGNTTGNTLYMGLVAEGGDWIYYSISVQADDAPYGAEWHLTKTHVDGGESIVILTYEEGPIRSINIIEDWIYFNMGYRIYRMRTDGSDLELLRDGRNFNTTVVGDWVYFLNESSENEEDSILRMRRDGTNEEALVFENVSRFFVHEGWIYYREIGVRGGIYRIRLDGSEKTKLSDDVSAGNIIGCFNIYDGWIYYQQSGSINKMRLDGTEHQVVVHGDHIYRLNVFGGWIYYSIAPTVGVPSGSLNRVRTDGSSMEIISFYSPHFIFVVDGWIFYKDGDIIDTDNTPIELARMMRIRMDGTGWEFLH